MLPHEEQSGRFLRRPKQDYPAATVAEFCTAVDTHLEGAIYDYLLQHNAKPKPFVWSKTADDILARELRALDALDEIRGNR